MELVLSEDFYVSLLPQIPSRHQNRRLLRSSTGEKSSVRALPLGDLLFSSMGSWLTGPGTQQYSSELPVGKAVPLPFPSASLLFQRPR